MTVIVPGVSEPASLDTVRFVEPFAVHLMAGTVSPPFGKHLNLFRNNGLSCESNSDDYITTVYNENLCYVYYGEDRY